MVDERPDGAQLAVESELVRPYIAAIGASASRGPRHARRAVPPRAAREDAARDSAALDTRGDITIVLLRDEIFGADRILGADRGGSTADKPAGRRSRALRAIAVPAIIAAVLLLLGGAYLLLLPTARQTALPDVTDSATAPPHVPSHGPSTAQVVVMTPPTSPRPSATRSATHQMTPSPTRPAAAIPKLGDNAPHLARSGPSMSLTPTTPPPVAVTGAIVGLAGMCLDNNGQGMGNGNRIQLYGCNSSVAQVWTVQPDGTMQVQGKCLQVTGTSAGSATQLWDCDGSGGEIWHADRSGHVVNSISGLCLDVQGSETSDGTQIDIASCTGAPNQIWALP